MPEMSQEEYQKQYDVAAAALDAGAVQTIPPVEAEAKPVVVEPVVEAPKVVEAAPPVVDELSKLREELAASQKQVADNKAWATKEAQRRAELERQFQQQQREQSRPAILDANPELAEAIKYVASDPAPQQEADSKRQAWFHAIDTAHPGIFAADADPELVEALVAKRDASSGAWDDPLVAIRDISAEKLAFAERQISKRFAVESAKQAEKSAMSVPGAGSGGAVRKPVDPDLEAVQRIQNMSDADFAKEVRKVKGF